MFRNKVLFKGDRPIFIISFLVTIAIFLYSGFFIRFQVALNDFWGVLYYAKHLTLTDPASLYNGFFPIGYAFLFRFIPYGYVAYFAFAINIVTMGLFAGWLSTLFFRMKKSAWAVIPVFLVTMFYPLIFCYGNTTGPDIGTAALAFGGIYFLWKSEFGEDRNIHQTRDDFLAGLLFGLAALFRSHGIIISGAVLLSYTAVMGIRQMWERKTIPITLALVFLIQVGVNLVSGHGPLETGQNFTAYITFNGGMDWWHIPPEAFNFSFFNQILQDPLRFIKLFIPLFLKLVVYGLPALFCVFLLQEPREKKFAWFALGTTVIYSGLVAIGTSATDRGPLPLVGTTILCAGLLGMELWSRGKKIIGSSKPLAGLALAGLAIAVIWVGSSWYESNQEFLALYREQSNIFRQVQDRLVTLGMKSPGEAFTNKFVLYFPDMPPYRPHMNGGWENYSLWGYREEFPEIPTDSWEKFIAECSKQKIKFLVLSPGASAASDFLGTLYNYEFTPPEVEFVGKIHYTRIFKIKDPLPK
jgi:hypothetical protein